MTRSFLSMGLLCAISCLWGCQIVIPGPLPADAGPKVQRNAGYALLLSVLDQEGKVDGILMLKTVTPPTAELIKRLAADAKAQSKALKDLAEREPPISWGSQGLPVPEIEARAWIADRTTVSLLTGRGTSFEVDLILSQLKATEYIAALSNALAKDDPSKKRVECLDAIKTKFVDFNTAFRARLVTMIESKATDKPAEGDKSAESEKPAANDKPAKGASNSKADE